MCLRGFAEILSKNWVKVWVWIKGGLNLLSFKMAGKKKEKWYFQRACNGYFNFKLKRALLEFSKCWGVFNIDTNFIVFLFILLLILDIWTKILYTDGCRSFHRYKGGAFAQLYKGSLQTSIRGKSVLISNNIT